MKEVIITLILQGFDQKNHFFKGWSWFKFDNFGTGTKYGNYTSVTKKVKVRNFWLLLTTSAEVTGEKGYW